MRGGCRFGLYTIIGVQPVQVVSALIDVYAQQTALSYYPPPPLVIATPLSKLQ